MSPPSRLQGWGVSPALSGRAWAVGLGAPSHPGAGGHSDGGQLLHRFL